MFNCDLPHLIEGFRRQNGISYAQLAERMGWPVGTLTSYMHRLRAGRPATREDLDDFARGLSDPRFELGDEVVVRHHLHAAAGVTPTPEEVADFLSDYFPKAPEDPNPSYLFDIRGYVRWVNPRMASLTAAMGGPPAAEITVRAHAWVLADIRGRLPERLALPKVVDAAPDAFRLDADTVLSLRDRLAVEPFHTFEVLVHPEIGGIFGDEDSREETVGLLEQALRIQNAVIPGFLKSTWYGPVSRRLSANPLYREALRRAAVSFRDAQHPIPADASRVVETPFGRLFLAEAVPIHDPRMGIERVLPASRGLWGIWQEMG